MQLIDYIATFKIIQNYFINRKKSNSFVNNSKRYISELSATMKKIIIYLALLSPLLFTTCAKTEGVGGTSQIIGKVYVYEYNATFTLLKQEYFAPEEDVYIVYGDDIVYNDKFDTHFDGTFRFQYLRKGTYTIYVYSEDKNNPTSLVKIPVKVDVEISKNSETVDVGIIEIYKKQN